MHSFTCRKIHALGKFDCCAFSCKQTTEPRNRLFRFGPAEYFEYLKHSSISIHRFRARLTQASNDCKKSVNIEPRINEAIVSVFFRQKPGSHFLFAANKCILNGIESGACLSKTALVFSWNFFLPLIGSCWIGAKRIFSGDLIHGVFGVCQGTFELKRGVYEKVF